MRLNPLRALLISRGYTLNSMADRAGIRRWRLRDASRGASTLSEPERAAIAVVLGVDVHEVPAVGRLTT